MASFSGRLDGHDCLKFKKPTTSVSIWASNRRLSRNPQIPPRRDLAASFISLPDTTPRDSPGFWRPTWDWQVRLWFSFSPPKMSLSLVIWMCKLCKGFLCVPNFHISSLCYNCTLVIISGYLRIFELMKYKHANVRQSNHITQIVCGHSKIQSFNIIRSYHAPVRSIYRNYVVRSTYAVRPCYNMFHRNYIFFVRIVRLYPFFIQFLVARFGMQKLNWIAVGLSE